MKVQPKRPRCWLDVTVATLTVALCIFFQGCKPTSSGPIKRPEASLQESPPEQTTQVSSKQIPSDERAGLEAKIKQLEDKIEEGERLSADHKKEVDHLNGRIDAIEKERDKLKSELNRTHFWLLFAGAMIGVVVAGLFGIIVFGKSKNYPNEHALVESTCPRCNWQIAATDYICGNPDCKTRLR